MKNNKKSLKAKPVGNSKRTKLHDPAAPYKLLKSAHQAGSFTYTEFKKIADKTPFSLIEWASILHLSERTLQRYAKGNSDFAAINAERALQIEKVIKQGKAAFGSAENFFSWLSGKPSMLEGSLSFESLYSLDGIEKVLVQLGRIQHGLFA